MNNSEIVDSIKSNQSTELVAQLVVTSDTQFADGAIQEMDIECKYISI